MKKAAAIVFIIVFLAAFYYLGWGRDAYYNHRDRTYWEELSSHISRSQVEEVILYSTYLSDTVSLEGEELNTFITKLCASEFYRSNWRLEGPTGPLISIKFKDGSKELNFQYWGKGVYETAYDGAQFLITNEELDVILHRHGVYFK
ncbi:MAG: hypothetical protein ACOX7I_02750 [Oscillospiraceae bacterium]|jgi:hypothetical protein